MVMDPKNESREPDHNPSGNEIYLHYPYPSRRQVVFARNGMVVTGQALAAQVGLSILQQGGNAVDAAVAVAASLTVLEPTSNGIGGDAFAIIWSNDKMYGLNASGPSPDAISLEKIQQAGYSEMPATGFAPVTVPGAPAAWFACSQRFGRLPFSKLLEPAVTYAEQGYPVSPELSRAWMRAFKVYKQHLKGEEFKEWFRVFSNGDRAPQPGELWRLPDHANTLQKIADSGTESFYRGELAEAVDQFSRMHNGYIRASDLNRFSAKWVEPISISYRGYDVWELPPNSQGLVVLQALKILNGFNTAGSEDEKDLHNQIEAIKLAFADGMAQITDPEMMTVTAESLLASAHIERCRSMIGKRAVDINPVSESRGGTVYLATADNEGNMVSFIQSNYMGFGSGLVVPDTGIALQNRGHSFSLDSKHVNRLEPGKRPYHTIIPGFLTKNDTAVGPFGVMGGFMQPQGHVQVLVKMIDYQLNPQAALDAPRWQWLNGKTVVVEDSFSSVLTAALERRGHDIKISTGDAFFGRGQIIQRNQSNGVLIGATEPRTDGTVAAW